MSNLQNNILHVNNLLLFKYKVRHFRLPYRSLLSVFNVVPKAKKILGLVFCRLPTFSSQDKNDTLMLLEREAPALVEIEPTTLGIEN